MKLEGIADKLGFREKQGGYVLRYNGLEVNLVLYHVPGSYVKMPMLLFVFSQRLGREAIQKIQKASGLKGCLLESVIAQDNAFLVNANFKTKEKLDIYLEKMSLVIQSLQLTQWSQCPFCDQPDMDSVRIIKGAVISVHEACVQGYVEKIETHLDTVGSSKKNTLISTILAILGGFIGLLPSILVLSFTGFYSAWLFALIPFAAFYGFKLGGAQKGAFVMPLIILVSFSMSISFMFYIYFDLAAYYEVTFEAFLAVEEVMAAFTQDMLTTIVFTLIAIWVSWKYIYKQTQGQIKKDIKELKG